MIGAIGKGIGEPVPSPSRVDPPGGVSGGSAGPSIKGGSGSTTIRGGSGRTTIR